MTSTPYATYEDFFRAAFDGRAPFDYQKRLAVEAELPSLVHVPTGSGKTAAVLGAWLWRRMTKPGSVGRRLIYCLPMRTLVEQTKDIAKAALTALSLDDCLKVHTLMGGEPDGRRGGKSDWDIEPERECVIIGTQDMLLSRALNRGYAMSRFKWPVHFGLLTNDCLWVFDEVQLMGNGLATSAQLAAFRKKFGTAGLAHSIWMSATLRKDWLKTVDWESEVDGLEVLSLSEADRGSAVLSERLTASKVLRKADERCRLPKGLAEFVKERHRPGTQTLVVVNTVRRAREAYQELNKLYAKTDAPLIELIHSRFRPAERKSWPELLKDKSYAGGMGRIIVATQVIEAGVDISAKLLVTDLAPFSSLVQRFGRCNREGKDGRAEIFWVDRPTTTEKLAVKPELDEKEKRELSRPYDWRELEVAERLVENLTSASPDDLADVAYDEPYRPTHVLRRRDLIDLFDTTPDLSGYDLDISRFVRDSDERDVSVAWRELKGKRPGENEDKPSRDELCAVPIHELKGFVGEKVKAWSWDALEGEWDEAKPDSLRAGMTVLLDAKSGGYDKKLGWAGKEAKKPVIVIPVEERDSEPEEPYAGDRWSFPDYAQELSAHSLETRLALEEILRLLNLQDLEQFRAKLLTAAQHHDWGKAHKIFQQTLHDAETAEQDFSPLLAKSKSNRKHKRPKFRHELASALALLQTRADDLTVYLAACHHGKVRMSIRALPGEEKPKDNDGRFFKEKMFARGIWDGEELPAADLGDGLRKERVTLDLQPMLLGAGDDGARSWLERMIALRDRDEIGVFRLAFLEALIRAADVRASKFPKVKYCPEGEAE